MQRARATDSVEARTLSGLVRYFARLGAWGFGGPIALAGYMHRDLVEKRGWYLEAEYQQGLAVAQAMPGPLAAQLAMWLGYLEAGTRGAALVALPFVLASRRRLRSIGQQPRFAAHIRRHPRTSTHIRCHDIC